MSESVTHQYIKTQIAQALALHPSVTNLVQERDFGLVRADISFDLDGKPCAVEIQYSDKGWANVFERTYRYYTLGIYVLWVLYDDKPLVEGGQHYHVPPWQLCLHIMYYGILFHWVEGQIVCPVHLERCENPNIRYYDEQLDRWTSPPSKSRRIPWFLDNALITDLQPMIRKARNYGACALPAAHLLNLPYEKIKQARDTNHSFLDERRFLRHSW